MGGLIKSEFRKLITTQVWFWLLLATLALTALGVVAQLAPSDAVHNTPHDIRTVFTTADNAYIAVFVLGVLSVTTEFRYQTITPTVLATPSRWALVTAKMITYAIAGAVYATLCVLLQIAMALPWLSAKGFSVSLGDYGIPGALAGVFAVVALFGIVGMGIGALLRNQIVAVTIGVVFLLILQNLVLIIPVVKHAYPYLPGGADAAILGTVADRTVNDVHLLPTAGGVVVLLLWAFVPAILGASLTLNRDIT